MISNVVGVWTVLGWAAVAIAGAVTLVIVVASVPALREQWAIRTRRDHTAVRRTAVFVEPADMVTDLEVALADPERGRMMRRLRPADDGDPVASGYDDPRDDDRG